MKTQGVWVLTARPPAVSLATVHTVSFIFLQPQSEPSRVWVRVPCSNLKVSGSAEGAAEQRSYLMS